MSEREDDFSVKTVRFLGDQVNHRCSNPKCGAPTLGPGDPGEISNVGVAAHITAASKNGPRYDETLTPEQRRHPDNGIHLCQSCGKLVDDALSIHTVAQLRQWKEDAVQLARRALVMRDIDPDGRIKLRRETNHKMAVDLLRGMIKARGQLMRGVDLAERARTTRQHSDSWERIGHSIGEWTDTSEDAKKQLFDIAFELRVVWGQPAVRNHVLWVLAALENWRHAFAYKYCNLCGHARVREPPADDPRDSPAWDWERIFDGDAEHIAMMTKSMDATIAQVETWATQFIASRGAA
jgi:hypothetical protein